MPRRLVNETSASHSVRFHESPQQATLIVKKRRCGCAPPLALSLTTQFDFAACLCYSHQARQSQTSHFNSSTPHAHPRC
ncbi:hypothetical protein HBI24_123200 [Parastagonospora nodorum]|nr:hypothetical protein HBH53_031490 [Parastagonospora nodorum]KAH4006769.1 hypothetical protein HBI10_018910 [Parastagonospora nodorum]KAH4059585.1 hypothetical protein HBH49_020200 [Parastagonospora nodorum]KAH4075034.1 hypothetical protein HBH50_033060 [Parastagonospora nodorum]KAH4097093.1 hypothetical protein HBH48_041940 [Parastagonospora nodorum]